MKQLHLVVFYELQKKLNTNRKQKTKNKKQLKSNEIMDLTLSALNISESYIKIKIILNFSFDTSLQCLKRFYEGL